jgi:hypothetical protein
MVAYLYVLQCCNERFEPNPKRSERGDTVQHPQKPLTQSDVVRAYQLRSANLAEPSNKSELGYLQMAPDPVGLTFRWA